MFSGSHALVALACAWLSGLMCAAGLPDGADLGVGLLALCLAMSAAAWAFAPRPASPSEQPSSASAAQQGWAVIAVLSAGFGAGVALGPPPRAIALPPAGLARIEATVIETRLNARDEPECVVRVLHGQRIEDGAPLAESSLLIASPLALAAGTRVRLLAKVSPYAPFRNPSPHPRWPARHAIAGRATLPDAAAAHVLDTSWWRTAIEDARTHVRARLNATLSPTSAGLARALVLGDGAAVSLEDQAAVRASGLTHVFAVSGMHVTLIIGALVVLLQRLLLRVPACASRFEARRIACALGIPSVIVYASFAGGAPSAWRSAVTSALTWSLVTLGRRPRALPVTAAAVLLLGAFEPREALRPGFLLSVLATAALLAQAQPGPGALGLTRAALAQATASCIMTAPLVLWCFGDVPLISVLANLVLVPIGSFALLPAATLHALACALPLPLPSSLSANVLDASGNAFLRACHAFAALGPRTMWPPLDVPQGIALSAAAVTLLLCATWRRRVMCVLVTVAVLGVLELRLRAAERPTGSLRVTFVDVGQGDSALLDLPDGRLMLIDAGGNPGGGLDPGSAVLEPLLRARRRDRIDIVVLTHPHPDHYGGLRALIERVPIGEIWDSGQADGEADLSHTSGEAKALLDDARTRGTRVLGPAELCGRPLHARGVVVRVLSPCPQYDSAYDANDNSLVLRVEHGARSLLLMGDAEEHAEHALVASNAPLRADVLKVGHHGSRTSSTPELLAAVAPKLAVISAGATNRFGHPHREVVERLDAHVPHVLPLATYGGTVVTSDGRTLTVTPYEGEPFTL